MIKELMTNTGLRQTWAILRKYPETRDDDRLLYKIYYNQNYANLPNTDRPVPLQAQVSKWRQRIQKEIDRSLKPSPETKARREKASRYYAKGA